MQTSTVSFTLRMLVVAIFCHISGTASVYLKIKINRTQNVRNQQSDREVVTKHLPPELNREKINQHSRLSEAGESIRWGSLVVEFSHLRLQRKVAFRRGAVESTGISVASEEGKERQVVMYSFGKIETNFVITYSMCN